MVLDSLIFPLAGDIQTVSIGKGSYSVRSWYSATFATESGVRDADKGVLVG